tara:strand:+ start:288 stop:461 length:174 start_codon:yes stop_codon:yes gene_type:complete
MRTQLDDLKADLKDIEHFLRSWEHYGKKKNLKQWEQPQWKRLEDKRDRIVSYINNIR